MYPTSVIPTDIIFHWKFIQIYLQTLAVVLNKQIWITMEYKLLQHACYQPIYNIGNISIIANI